MRNPSFGASASRKHGLYLVLPAGVFLPRNLRLYPMDGKDPSGCVRLEPQNL